jgi:AcrR family transcriptional regulator
MSAMAEAAHMSVGGVYHYFDTKRQLLLHGLNPEALALACTTFHEAMLKDSPQGQGAVASVYVEKSIYMFRLIQPAAMAALELGMDETKAVLESVLRQDADGLIEILATVTPELTDGSRADLAIAIRRTLLALSFDPHATEEDVRRQLTAVLRGFVAVEAPTSG